MGLGIDRLEDLGRDVYEQDRAVAGGATDADGWELDLVGRHRAYVRGCFSCGCPERWTGFRGAVGYRADI